MLTPKRLALPFSRGDQAMFTGYLWSGWWGCLRPQPELLARLFYAKWTVVHYPQMKLFSFGVFPPIPLVWYIDEFYYFSSSIDLSQGENAV